MCQSSPIIDKRTLFDAISDPVVYHDPDLRILWANRSAVEMTGSTMEEMVGGTCYKLRFDSDRPCEDCPVARALKTGRPQMGEVITPDGRRWSVSGYPVEDGQGQLEGAVEIARPIDMSEQEIRILQQNEESFRTLAEQSPNMIFIHWQGRNIYVNQRCEEILGYSREELCHPDFDFLTLIAPESMDLVRESAHQRAQGLDVESYEYTILTKDGRRIPAINSTRLISYQGKPALLGIVTDISDLKQAEADRLKLLGQMQHSQKLESLGVMAGGIAHDFNNLLMGVLGNASLALTELTPGSPARRSIEQVEIAASRAAELTKQLLAYSGKGRFLVQPVNLSSLVQEMTHLLQVSISKKARLECSFGEDIPAVIADAAQVQQVVMNLITNASEAIGEGEGTISVHTGVMQVDSDFLSESYTDADLPAGSYVFFEVADTGCGMDSKTLSKIFDPFYSTKMTGRGLGLAAVLGIVRGHRGAIRVDSEPGNGTTIRVLIPASAEGADRDGGQAATRKGFSGRGTILLVDDEAVVRNVARRMLQRLGFQVLTAVDGQQGVDMFREHSDRIDAVLLDLTMPRLGGEEVLRELQAIRADVPVILSSGFSEQVISQRFDGGELAGFVQKPYRLDALSRVLQQIMGGAHQEPQEPQ